MGSPDHAAANLRSMLKGLVPLRMVELVDVPADRLMLHLDVMECIGHKGGGRCRGAAVVLGTHGDDLQFGGRHRPDARRALVDGLAIGALLADGGISSPLGHWCARPHAGCPNPGGQPTVTRTVDDPDPYQPPQPDGRPIVDVPLPEGGAA